MRGLWGGAAALCVLAAAGRLAAGLPAFPVDLSLGGGKIDHELQCATC